MIMRLILSFLFLIPIWVASTASESPAPKHQDVDHIEDIEVEQTQVIITTTKDGPVEHLKIHIELVDIEANKKVNPVDLSGLWLTITRGRYTIPFLRPDTWYGVRFRSENQINGLKVVHEDERLVKTKPREENLAGLLMGNHEVPGIPGIPGIQAPPQITFLPPKIGIGEHGLPGVEGHVQSHQNHVLNLPGTPQNPQNPLGTMGSIGTFGSPSPLGSNAHGPSHSKVISKTTEKLDAIDVKMHRSLDGVENFESLYVTVSWKDHGDHDQYQRSNLTTGIVKLKVICDNSETKEEIKLKGDEDSVTIEITMDQKYDIEEMDSSKHQIKAHITPLKCHKICYTSSLVLSSGFGDFTKHLGEECKEISGTTSTTYLRNVKKISVMENSLSVNELIVETEVAESEYGIVTLVLQKLGGNVTENPIKKTFDTATSNGRFVVPLEDDATYAVSYEYVKTKPFHYTSNTHFLAESPAPNSTKPSMGLVDLSVIPTTFDYKHDKPGTVLKPEPPFLLISRTSFHSENPVLVKIEPFCNETGIKFRLDDHYPLHHLDTLPFLCGLEPKMYFCDKNVTYHKCDSTFCFSTSVLIGLDSYGGETQCMNLTNHFPPLKSPASHPFSQLISLCVSLFLLVSFSY